MNYQFYKCFFVRFSVVTYNDHLELFGEICPELSQLTGLFCDWYLVQVHWFSIRLPIYWFCIHAWYKGLMVMACKGRFSINSLRPRLNTHPFAVDVFKCNFLNENVWIPIKISLKFVPKGPINNIPALVQITAWRRQGDKPLSEPMMLRLLMHICVTRPQWVKTPTHQYWNSHYKDETAMRPSCPYNGNSYTGKTASLCWISLQIRDWSN